MSVGMADVFHMPAPASSFEVLIIVEIKNMEVRTKSVQGNASHCQLTKIHVSLS